MQPSTSASRVERQCTATLKTVAHHSLRARHQLHRTTPCAGTLPLAGRHEAVPPAGQSGAGRLVAWRSDKHMLPTRKSYVSCACEPWLTRRTPSPAGWNRRRRYPRRFGGGGPRVARRRQISSPREGAAGIGMAAIFAESSVPGRMQLVAMWVDPRHRRRVWPAPWSTRPCGGQATGRPVSDLVGGRPEHRCS
jgi:hypothetical protein